MTKPVIRGLDYGHVQKLVRVKEQLDWVDEDLSGIIEELWSRRLYTAHSCCGLGNPLGYISFHMKEQAQEFLQLFRGTNLLIPDEELFDDDRCVVRFKYSDIPSIKEILLEDSLAKTEVDLESKHSFEALKKMIKFEIEL